MIKKLFQTTWETFRYRTAVSGMDISTEKSELEVKFALLSGKLKQPRVLELGTRRSEAMRSTKHEYLEQIRRWCMVR